MQSRYINDQLAIVQVYWQQQGVLVSAAMNRMAGNSFERLEYFGTNQHWQIDNLVQGHYTSDNQQQILGFSDWQSTLDKRGFVAMLAAFFQQLQQGGTNTTMNNSVLQSHQLCENVLQRLS